MTRTLAIAHRPLALAAALLALTATAVAAKPAKMDSTTLGPLLCETTGGGKFVADPRLPRREDRPPAARRHPLDRQALPDLHHRRLLDERRPLTRGRAPARPGARHRPEQGRGRHLDRHRPRSPAGPSRGRTAPGRRSAGSATTATPATAAATTCTSPGAIRRPSPGSRRSWSTRFAARSRHLRRRPAGRPRAIRPPEAPGAATAASRRSGCSRRRWSRPTASASAIRAP